MYRLKTSWGVTTVDLKSVYLFNCKVDMWKQQYILELSLKDGAGTITALFDSFDDLIRTAKDLHQMIENQNILGSSESTQ